MPSVNVTTRRQAGGGSRMINRIKLMKYEDWKKSDKSKCEDVVMNESTDDIENDELVAIIHMEGKKKCYKALELYYYFESVVSDKTQHIRLDGWRKVPKELAKQFIKDFKKLQQTNDKKKCLPGPKKKGKLCMSTRAKKARETRSAREELEAIAGSPDKVGRKGFAWNADGKIITFVGRKDKNKKLKWVRYKETKCQDGKVKNAKGKCVKKRVKKELSDKQKKAKETRLARELVAKTFNAAKPSFLGDKAKIFVNGKTIEFVGRNVKNKKTGKSSLRWVRYKRTYKKKPVKSGPCKPGEYRRKSGHCAKKPTYKTMSGPCPRGKIKSTKTGRCVKGRKLSESARAKKALETRLAREQMEIYSDRPLKVGDKAKTVVNGKTIEFVGRKVKNKKSGKSPLRWVRVEKGKKRTTTQKGGKQKTKKYSQKELSAALKKIPITKLAAPLSRAGMSGMV